MCLQAPYCSSGATVFKLQPTFWYTKTQLSFHNNHKQIDE
ncbi:unnamed protein product [Acanthoscelides obtectus]|uniref:Uncharacterized protein n=1 Tax=Acanthoscelides obtectus TaxID=200917 RepID=A0A9P0MCM1_ACAOB|nr:unnamed protein product [Acanthoscelides obtectus]CAK1626275.1 hypothetical protein AOBTE_LOCUS3741 [Acanthoscelides obtectus]